MSDTPTAQDLLAQIHAFVETTRNHIATGGEVDLEGLDAKVQELCEMVLDMPKAQADEYRQPLTDLATELTELKQGMEAVQNDVREQLNELNVRHKAAKAYKTNETYKPKKTEE